MPLPLASAIQTFLCGGSRLPFGSGIFFQGQHSLRLPLSLVLTLVAMIIGTVWSLLDCKFRGMSLCAWPGLSWCPPFAGLFGGVGGSFARGFIFLVGFRIGPTFAVMLLLFAAVCSVSLVLAQFGKTHVWTGQGHIFATLPYKRRAPCWIKLKPEDLKEQIGKLAEKSMTPSFVDVTLRDGFGVPQVEYPQEGGLAPSIPGSTSTRTARTRFEVPSHPR